MLKIKDECKLKLQTSKTMKLFGSTKKLIGETKTGENYKSLQVVSISTKTWSITHFYTQ